MIIISCHFIEICAEFDNKIILKYKYFLPEK